MRWPLCYVACILRHFPGQELFEYIATRIDKLAGDCETIGDGMVWEESVRIAIILKFVAAAIKGWNLPFGLELFSGRGEGRRHPGDQLGTGGQNG